LCEVLEAIYRLLSRITGQLAVSPENVEDVIAGVSADLETIKRAVEGMGGGA
jgi:chorismate mutase